MSCSLWGVLFSKLWSAGAVAPTLVSALLLVYFFSIAKGKLWVGGRENRAMDQRDKYAMGSQARVMQHYALAADWFTRALSKKEREDGMVDKVWEEV